MEVLLEVILELILEGSIEVTKSKRVSKWIRYPLALLISLFIIAVIGLIGVVGVMLILKSNQSFKILLGGIIFIIIDIVLIISVIKGVNKELKSRNNQDHN